MGKGLVCLAGGALAAAGGLAALLLRGWTTKSPLSRRLASSRHGSETGAGGIVRALTRLITRRPHSFYDELPLVKLRSRSMEVGWGDAAAGLHARAKPCVPMRA